MMKGRGRQGQYIVCILYGTDISITQMLNTASKRCQDKNLWQVGTAILFLFFFGWP